MALCRAYLQERSLFRGQSHDYRVVLSKSWREVAQAHATVETDVCPLVTDYVTGAVDRRRFEDALRAFAAGAQDGPTFARYLGEPSGLGLLVGLMTHIRETFGPEWKVPLALSNLRALGRSFLVRYQSHFFNPAEDAFFRRYQPHTLADLAQQVLDFYDRNRPRFDIEFRIAHVAIDLMGVLQHYGTLGTPGIDLTEDLDVALWFATHHYDGTGYGPLPPGEPGVVYEFRVPVVTFSPEPVPGQAIDALPEHAVINLASLSPLFTRVRRQRGWYAIPGRAWSEIADYAREFPTSRKPARDYGRPEELRDRLAARGFSQSFLFPDSREDPFKAALEEAGVETFL